MPSVERQLCKCGKPRQFRKHYCDECNFERTVQRNKREGRIKSAERKSSRATRLGESGYPGIYRCSHTRDRWTGEIRLEGKRINIGTWLTPKEAFDARLKIYFELYGEYPIDRIATVTYNESMKGEPNTPLERATALVDHLIKIA